MREKESSLGDSLQPFAGTDSCLQSGEERFASQRGWGELRILTTPVSLMIKNTGGAPLDGEKLLPPFYHSIDGKKDSTGLGLAIVRSIARISSLRLTYEWQEGMHCFLLVKENKNNR